MIGMKKNIGMIMTSHLRLMYFQIRNLQEYEGESLLKTESIKIYNMEEFDLQKAKDGASLITRNGKKAKIISFNKGTTCFPIVVELENYNSNPVLYDEDGCSNICGSAFSSASDSEYDLLIKGEITMATIKEDYVSYEVAKLLKEKGFDQNCATYYLDGQVWRHYHGEVIPKGKQIYAAPTQAIAMKWLREVYGLFISIGNDDLDYNWQIFDVRNRTKDLDPTCLTESYGGYKKYELACTLAIKYCLKNLI